MRIAVDEKGLDAMISKLTDLEKRQIPFAESRAVNALAYKIQRDTIDRLLPQRFTLRSDWWKPGKKTGVNYFPSHKSQFPNIFARVNTLAPFMELQETGGTKKPKAGELYVPVPTFNARPNPMELIRPERRYRSLTGKTRSGNRRTLSHRGNYWETGLRNGKPSIAVRLLDDYRLPIAVMYIGKSSVQIKPRFGFVANARRIVDQEYLKVFEKELQHAIATAR